MELIRSLFFYFLPIWLLMVILIMAILGSAYFHNKRFLISTSHPMHILRSLILITLGSYWFITPSGFIPTLILMLASGIKFTIIYAIVRFCSDALTVKKQEIESPWSKQYNAKGF